LPTNKNELLELLKRKQARQFHQTLYPINQKSSNLNHWERIPQAKHIDIAYKVKKYIFKYEPLYIAQAHIPEFDERFVGSSIWADKKYSGIWADKEYSGIWSDNEYSGICADKEYSGICADKEYSGIWADKEYSGICADYEY
jgi:hypothetical protein